MTQWAFPFLSVNNDRTYSDSDFSLFYKNLFRNGVAITIASALKVKEAPNKGMRIIVSSGVAVVEGRQYFNTEDLAIDVPVASTTQDRKDCVVVCLDLNNRVMSAIYKQGTTDLERTEQVYELKLAEILVARNASGVTNANIKDFRADSEACGYTSPYEKVNVSGLEQQYQEKLEEAFNAFTANAQEKERKMDSMLSEMSVIFSNWLDGLKNELDENQAGNLQNQIDELKPVFALGTIQHSLKGYPIARALYSEYGAGVVPVGDEPTGAGGGTVLQIPLSVEHLTTDTLQVKVPNKFTLTSQEVIKISEKEYRFVSGYKAIQINLGGI